MKNQEKIKNYTERLNEEEKNVKKKGKQKFEKTEEVDKIGAEKDISSNVEKLVNEVSKMMRNIYAATDERNKANAEYLINTTNTVKMTDPSEKYGSMINPVSKNKKKIRAENSDMTLEEIIEHSKGSPNYRILNENYRRKLNKQLMNFNPKIHLDQIKENRNKDGNFDEAMQLLTEQIDSEIKELTHQRRYLHKYKNYMEEKERSKAKKNSSENSVTLPKIEVRREIKSNQKSNLSKYLHTQSTNIPTSENDTALQNKFPHNKRATSLKKKKQKKHEIKKRLPDREIRERELELMKSALDKISTTLSKEKLFRYCDNPNWLLKHAIPEQKHKYFNELENVPQDLKRIQADKLIRGLDNDQRNNKKSNGSENQKLLAEIDSNKNKLLLEIKEDEKL